jgi:hypothetical protein
MHCEEREKRALGCEDASKLKKMDECRMPSKMREGVTSIEFQSIHMMELIFYYMVFFWRKPKC